MQECAICLSKAETPWSLPCHHHFCKACLDDYMAKSDTLTCPLCGNPFTKEQPNAFAFLNKLADKMRMVEIPDPKEPAKTSSNSKASTSFCRDLQCTPGSNCTKKHVVDLLGPWKEPAEPQPPPTKIEPTPPYSPPKRDGCTYCLDLSCPGKPKAMCASKHEADFGLP